MDFEDFDLESRQRIGRSMHRRFAEAVAADDTRDGVSYQQRLFDRMREPAPAVYSQGPALRDRNFD